jgi:response regulator RpfG family c-di-GMP phosphodiesterase
MLKALLYFMFREAIRPSHLLYAGVVGIGLGLAVPDASMGSPYLYVVPYVFLVVMRAIVRARSRRNDLLIQLPQERPDPAFVMDNRGEIIAATGNTEELLRRHGITNLRGFFSETPRDPGPGPDPGRAPDPIAECFTMPLDGRIHEFTCYSDVTRCWYQVRAKGAAFSDEVLVWFEDITDRKRLDARLAMIRRFSNEIIDSLAEIVEEHNAFSRLAGMILDDGYRGVFIAFQGADDSLEGNVFVSRAGELRRSEPIRIAGDAPAPILLSRETRKIVSGTVAEFDSPAAFLDRYPVDPRVQEFLGFDVENFVNYHEENVAIIAFNKLGGVRESDRFTMETMVNTARTVNTLIELAEANDARFLQSIIGLCAAAEFSDEITGRHIFRVNQYSELLARHLGLAEATARALGQIAAIHDIGKVAIPHIIKLPRPLSADERREMELHTIFGAQIIRRMLEEGEGADKDPRLRLAESIALNHHQRWDGTGYPGLLGADGQLVDPVSQDWHRYAGLRPLAGEEVPLEARLVSLADKYDALRSARQYKAAMSHREVCDLLLSKEDPPEAVFGKEVADAFRARHRDFEAIYEAFSDSLPVTTPRIP